VAFIASVRTEIAALDAGSQARAIGRRVAPWLPDADIIARTRHDLVAQLPACV